MVLTLEQLTKHRRLCAYCLVASALSLAAVPPAGAELRTAVGCLRRR